MRAVGVLCEARCCWTFGWRPENEQILEFTLITFSLKYSLPVDDFTDSEDI